MSLATRLDRLRGCSHDVAAVPLSDSLKKLRPIDRAQSRQTDIEVLAQALSVEQVSEGVLLRTRNYQLPASSSLGSLCDLPEVCDLDAADWVYLDTETTGLSGGIGNLAFMIGLARLCEGTRLQVRQYLLGSFSAEADMLRAVAAWVGPEAVLVSYNGKGFDVPLLDARVRLQRIGFAFAARRHLDLMYNVRRAYRKHWPDCRLQTAERRALDLHRVGDQPGAEAPLAWQAWLRQGNTDRLYGTLQHNFQDVVSLALLHRYLPGVYDGRQRIGCDLAAIGRAWQGVGRAERAQRVWEGAAERLEERGTLELAALHRRRGEWERAAALWSRLQSCGSALAALELSKYHEHRTRDYARALSFASRCAPTERHVRLERLQAKLASDPQLSLLQVNAESAKAMK